MPIAWSAMEMFDQVVHDQQVMSPDAGEEMEKVYLMQWKILTNADVNHVEYQQVAYGKV